MLIIMNGSIASGKSTLSRKLAATLRTLGHRAAVIELDRVYEMLADDPKSDPAIWKSARRLASALAATLLDDGEAFVLVDGAFWTSSERDDLCSLLPASMTAAWLTLVVPFGEALRRVQADPTRGISKDPAFLGSHVSECMEALAHLPASDRVLRTDVMGAEPLARELAELAQSGQLCRAMACRPLSVPR